jgi:hypothetical protein
MDGWRRVLKKIEEKIGRQSGRWIRDTPLLEGWSSLQESICVCVSLTLMMRCDVQ